MLRYIKNVFMTNNPVLNKIPENTCKNSSNDTGNSDSTISNPRGCYAKKNFTLKLASAAQSKGKVNNVVDFIENFKKYPEKLAKNATEIDNLETELIHATVIQKEHHSETSMFWRFISSPTAALAAMAANKQVKKLTAQLEAAKLAQIELIQEIPQEYQPLLDYDDDTNNKGFKNFLNRHAFSEPDDREAAIIMLEKYTEAIDNLEKIRKVVSPEKARCFNRFLNEQMDQLRKKMNSFPDPKSNISSLPNVPATPTMHTEQPELNHMAPTFTKPPHQSFEQFFAGHSYQTYYWRGINNDISKIENEIEQVQRVSLTTPANIPLPTSPIDEAFKASDEAAKELLNLKERLNVFNQLKSDYIERAKEEYQRSLA